jgi:hypothetical protein
MNEEHPEENFSNILHSGYDDFDENIPWDEEELELSEEELDSILDRSSERAYKDRF